MLKPDKLVTKTLQISLINTDKIPHIKLKRTVPENVEKIS